MRTHSSVIDLLLNLNRLQAMASQITLRNGITKETDYRKKTVALVRERPPLFGEVSANVCG
jgi:hypothetical protein